MSVHSESNPSGAIPHFPFQERPAEASVGAGAPPAPGLGKPGHPRLPEDFTTLRAALDAAVQALRSFHDYVGVLEQQQQRQAQAAVVAVVAPPAAPVRAAVAMPPAADLQPLQVPMLPPRQSFPVGQFETGMPSRAVLTPAQQAQLDAALAIAFAGEPAAAPRPLVPAPAALPVAAALTVPAVVPPAPPRPPEVSALSSQEFSHAMPPVPVESPTPPPVFALVSPPPAAAAPVEPPASRMPEFPAPSPFAMAAPVVEREATLMAGAVPASPALMAAAPPLPGTFAPLAGLSAAPVPVPPPAMAPVLPVPMPVPPSALAGATGTMLPFSPFQGLEPAPPPPAADAVIRPEGADVSWPSSPFFGSAQAATAPFRMVEPPPVVATTLVEPVPAPPAASPAASFPPIPDQGQVFNFAELLRANGQR